MLNKINSFLNTLMGSCIGVFIGHSIYSFWDFKTHPGLYAMCSAPWYTGIWVYGIFTLLVLISVTVVKLIIRNKIN